MIINVYLFHITLTDTFSIDHQSFTISGALSSFYDTSTGLYLHAPPITTPTINKYTISVRTLHSAPFILPQGAVLVSGVYDICISKSSLEEPVRVEIEHCIDASDPLYMCDMSFAIGHVDYDKKEFIFDILLDKECDMRENTGSISIKESCLLCIVYKGTTQ